MADAARGSWLQQFGDIDYVKILTDRESGKSKGLAFVKYDRSYHAALALEQCDARESGGGGGGGGWFGSKTLFFVLLQPFRERFFVLEVEHSFSS